MSRVRAVTSVQSTQYTGYVNIMLEGNKRFITICLTGARKLVDGVRYVTVYKRNDKREYIFMYGKETGGLLIRKIGQ